MNHRDKAPYNSPAEPARPSRSGLTVSPEVNLDPRVSVPATNPVQDRIDSDWAPGVPDDPGLLPTTLYQALAGRVYTLVTYPDESTVRGEIPLEQLEDIVGSGRVLEGWYSITGEYLGEHPPGTLA